MSQTIYRLAQLGDMLALRVAVGKGEGCHRWWDDSGSDSLIALDELFRTAHRRFFSHGAWCAIWDVYQWIVGHGCSESMWREMIILPLTNLYGTIRPTERLALLLRRGFRPPTGTRDLPRLT